MNAAEARHLTAVAVEKKERESRARAVQRATDVVAFIEARIERSAHDGLRGVVVKFDAEPISNDVRAIVIKSLMARGFNVVRSSTTDMEVSW